MVRRISLSQYRSKVRQNAAKRRQALAKLKRAAQKSDRDRRAAINRYNQKVREHNARVRAYRQRINSALAKLRRHATSPRYTSFRTSVYTLHEAYIHLERTDVEPATPQHELLIDLSERENANSLEVMNALLGDKLPEEEHDNLQTTAIADELKNISVDLDKRWRGAVFALNPQNPDAARHFCTSAREIFTKVFELKAPDTEVESVFPGCAKTNQGKPQRREKIKFFFHQKGVSDFVLEEFAERNVENILGLFEVLNEGTHGAAGAFDLPTLLTIKRRVEDGIIFLSNLVC